jgi:hypothetical protein
MCRKTLLLSPLCLQGDWFQILYQYKEYKEVTSVTYLGLRLDRHVDWKAYIEQIIPKMGSAYRAVRFMYYFINEKHLELST